MKPEFLSKLGTWIFGIVFIVFGLNHFMNLSVMKGYVPLPGATFWVILTGLAFILAGLSLLINKQTKLAMILLGIMLLIFVLSIHLPGLFAADKMQVMMSMTNLLKDLALAGAAFYFAGKAAA